MSLAIPGVGGVMAGMNSTHLCGMKWLQRGLLWGAVLMAVGGVGAVERKLLIEAPATTVVGEPLLAAVHAFTDAGQGEQVGFLQAEFSVDDGKTWTAICYLQKSGPKIRHAVQLTPGGAGTSIRIRARAAFRDGLAGDVDFAGAAIVWHGSWGEWKTPPAQQAQIKVTAN